MRKLWLIFRREYLVRVRKRSFILATILTPLALAALAVGSGLITAMSAQAKKEILVKDDSGIFENSTTSRDNLQLTFSADSIDRLKETYDADGYELLIHIPPFDDLNARSHRLAYYSEGKPSIIQLGRIEGVISRAFREYKIDASNIDRSVYESFRTDIQLESTTVDAAGKEGSGKMAAILGTVLGIIMGILMYIVILIYGQMVMRSVMEEKISRIAEVMISSVKPFQLMMGKILGVGAVALTQLAIWMILIPVVLSIVPFFVPGFEPTQISDLPQGTEAMQQLQEQDFNINMVIDEFFRLNWVVIIPSFILFFLGGFFIYSSVFAARAPVRKYLGTSWPASLAATIIPMTLKLRCVHFECAQAPVPGRLS